MEVDAVETGDCERKRELAEAQEVVCNGNGDMGWFGLAIRPAEVWHVLLFEVAVIKISCSLFGFV